jgi:acyl-CoA synthetase (AMP-forming)/AMP-acid ligase II
MNGDNTYERSNPDRPWLKSYPPGVPADIDASQYSSLVGLMEESFQKIRRRVAYSFMGKAFTFGQIDSLSAAPSRPTCSPLGLAPGDRVAIMMPNVPQYPVAVAAILRAGMVVVNVNPLYTPRELEHQLKDSGAKAIVISRTSPTLQQVHGGRADEACGAGRHGRHARPAQGRAGQLRGAQRQEDGAGVATCRARCASTTRWPSGTRLHAHSGPKVGPTTSRCCSTPAAPPA